MWPPGGARCFGGPADYTGELGGYERMMHKHLQLGITGSSGMSGDSPAC